MFTTAILTFIAAWNEFLIALSMVNKKEMQTATVAISKFTGVSGFDQPFGTQMAAGVIVTVPLIALVLVFQRRIVAGYRVAASSNSRPDSKDVHDPGHPARPRLPRGEATRWWRDAVIYQVYVRSFADSDGDGVGDLPGIRSRLPYLVYLGVDALWLTPFYVSPMADFGYDVADYRDVDPLFGTLADARDLIADAHGHGLRIIVDVVPNHTSDKHAWFQAALAAAPAPRTRPLHLPGRTGARRDRTPNDWESVFGGPAWTRLPDGQWYLHLFASEQPDLNWENPEVHAEFADILTFWLDLGVDGFRVDVAHGMAKAPGLPDVGHANQVEMLGTAVLPYFDQDSVHDIHRAWRRLLDSYDGERIAVAEAWAPTPQRLAHYTRPDELHQAFNFHYLTAAWDADELRQVIEESSPPPGRSALRRPGCCPTTT